MFSNRVAKLTLLFVLASVPVSVFVSEAAAKTRKIQAGSWGGDQIKVKVEANNASIEYSCAHGTISGPLVVDSKGRFKLTGTHTAEMGGPTRSDAASRSRPAVYTGTVNGKKMTLTVTLTDSNEVAGTFTVVLGEESRLFRCM